MHLKLVKSQMMVSIFDRRYLFFATSIDSVFLNRIAESDDFIHFGSSLTKLISQGDCRINRLGPLGRVTLEVVKWNWLNELAGGHAQKIGLAQAKVFVPELIVDLDIGHEVLSHALVAHQVVFRMLDRYCLAIVRFFDRIAKYHWLAYFHRRLFDELIFKAHPGINRFPFDLVTLEMIKSQRLRM